MLKVILADDHRVLREGLKKIIEQTKDMVVVAEAADGSEVLSRVTKMPADILLLDISMPGPSGLDILKQVKARFPKLAVLMLSQHPENQYAVRAMRAGAAGYLTKESASSQLINAIRKAAGGGKFVSESLAEKMVDALNNTEGKPLHESLSDREYEILRLMGSGKTVSTIAQNLSLSVKTVSTYRARVLEKMHLSKTAELILYAIQHGFVETDSSVGNQTVVPVPARRPRTRV